MKRASDIKEFLIFVEGPEEEMHKLEETIREKKCVWDLCVEEPWLFGVYSTEVKKCGHARLEFCGDGTKHFDVYIKHFSDHMRQNPTHMCRFSSPPTELTACAQPPASTSVAPGAVLPTVLVATSVPDLCLSRTRVPSTASPTASAVPVVRRLSQPRAAPLSARSVPPPMSLWPAGSVCFPCITYL